MIDRPQEESWRVRVTADDVLVAARAWWRARTDGAPQESLDELWEDLVRLWRAEMVQGPDAGVAHRGGARPRARRRHRAAPGCPHRRGSPG